MIPMSSGGGAGIAAFPDPPQGDPGQIADAARRLTDAGGSLDDVETGLRGASNEVALDWQGYAASLYHGCTEQLTGIARGAAETFRDCAHAVSSYGRDLDDVQQKVKALKTQYDDAVHRQQTATGQALGFSNQITSATKPDDATRLSGEASAASRQAGDATGDANHYAQLATQAINDFKDKARGYASTLEGIDPGTPGGPLASPFVASGSPGPTFGFPGLRNPLTGGSPTPVDLTGVAHVGDPWNSPIPGYGTHMDATHGNLQSTDDLTDLILLLAAPVAGKAVEGLGGAALDWLTGKGVSKSGEIAIDKIEQKVLEGGRNLPGRFSNAGRTALERAGLKDPDVPLTPKELEEGQAEFDRFIKKTAAQLADQTGVLPPTVRELVDEFIDGGAAYRNYPVAKIAEARAALARMNNPAAKALGQVLGTILNHLP
jgi:uncharacterized protein YukE